MKSWTVRALYHSRRDGQNVPRLAHLQAPELVTSGLSWGLTKFPTPHWSAEHCQGLSWGALVKQAPANPPGPLAPTPFLFYDVR